MTDLPSVNAARLIRALQRAGFFCPSHNGQPLRAEASRPAPVVRIVVPYHGSADVKRGILRSTPPPDRPLAEDLIGLL
jgi:predicted RNA binding protein YcfA (HicA-like mRNA interferase family)